MLDLKPLTETEHGKGRADSHSDGDTNRTLLTWPGGPS